MFSGRARSVLARVAGAVLIVLSVAFGPAVGDGLRGDALPLPSAAPRVVDPQPRAPTRLDCQRLALGLPEPVPHPPAPFGSADLRDPSGTALSSFYAALAAAGSGRGIARVMYFGDSHVAADSMTGRIRHNLQSRFGDAGVGFLLPAKPLKWYSHTEVELGQAAGWDVLAVRKAHDLERRVGPAGFALIAQDSAWATFRLRSSDVDVNRRARLQVFFLQQPAGGHASIMLDGMETKSWSTSSPGMEETAGYFESSLRRMPQEVEIGAFGDGPVTLYGLTLERTGSGVVLDTLGIPGARAKDHLLWDDDMYREHLVKRAPDLVVLSYGTNEGTDTGEPLSLFETNLRQVLSRVHAAVPTASCLLVGPTDHPQRVGARAFRPRKRTTQIIEAQRRIAAEKHCGFIDLVAVMGGPMSMLKLVSEHYAGGDYTHFTRRGYEAFADAISGAMVSGFKSWQRAQCGQGDRASQ
ncbi:MAG TPA: GDSL-type esterase/lipase family protein [Polyangiales bacterium]|nr:GDSL-type esterase/lipase family protein [Polyangiales bacterium]